MTNSVSRRNMLKISATSLVGLGLANSALAKTKIEPKWDRTVNLLIIGTGFAGLAAGLECHYLGLKDILIVDKMPTPGGNSIINGGAVAAAGTDLQEKANIKDNPDLMYNDILKAGGGLAHASLARKIADESVSNYEWLRDEIGVKFKGVNFHGGHSVPRSHYVEENQGIGFIKPMLVKLKEFGIPVQLRTIVDELIVNNKGCVVGAKVRTDYKFGHEDSGKIFYIRALKGVIIASGGFSQNVKMRMSHDPRLTEAFGSTNQPGATGEMIQEAQEIGANTIHMDWIQLGPWTSPDESGFGLAPHAVEPLVGYGPMINPKTSRRFVQETGNRKVRADAIVAIGEPAIIYTGEKNFMNRVAGHTMKPEVLKQALDSGVIKKYANLKELAEANHLDYNILKAENEKFDNFIRNKEDTEFHTMFFPDSQPNGDGPFYVIRLWPRVHHTMGGLEINEDAQVLNVRGKPIMGLYAAGEATGGVHGMVRLGTVAVADCIIMGRVAARTAAKWGGC